jgi:Acetyltransferase (GNAT) domain
LGFSDLALARRLERAEGRANADFVEARAHVFPDRNAAWMEAGGALAMFDGVDSPITQTFALGLNGSVASADLDRIELFFRARDAPVFHEVCPLADGTLWPLLNSRGYHVIEFTSVMWQPIGGITSEAAHPSRIVARPIRDAEHQLWASTATQGWSHLGGLTAFLEELASVNAERRHHVCYIAEMDGRAIAAAGIALIDGVALLAGASTIPAARRQGAQRALLAARLRDAAASGCDIAMMGALPGSESQRNAERQGFRIAYTRVKFQRTTGARPDGG